MLVKLIPGGRTCEEEGETAFSHATIISGSARQSIGPSYVGEKGWRNQVLGKTSFHNGVLTDLGN